MEKYKKGTVGHLKALLKGLDDNLIVVTNADSRSEYAKVLNNELQFGTFHGDGFSWDGDESNKDNWNAVALTFIDNN